MSNNKQSSIDWLISQLQKSKDWHRVLNEISQMSSARVDIIEQAKAMHKQEHGQTWDKSLDNLKSRGMNEMRAYTDFDNYYNETFVCKNEQH